MQGKSFQTLSLEQPLSGWADFLSIFVFAYLIPCPCHPAPGLTFCVSLCLPTSSPVLATLQLFDPATGEPLEDGLPMPLASAPFWSGLTVSTIYLD